MAHRLTPRQWSRWPLTHALLRAFDAPGNGSAFVLHATLAGGISMQRLVDDRIPDIFGTLPAEGDEHA